MTTLRMSSNWVDGERFFDREAELGLLRERMKNGTHTLLTAQRRMGKTSLVRELLRQLNDEGEVATVFVDVEAAMDAADAVGRDGDPSPAAPERPAQDSVVGEQQFPRRPREC